MSDYHVIIIDGGRLVARRARVYYIRELIYDCEPQI